MTNAIFPGTFDPITKGHLDIAERGSAIFDNVTIGVYDDSDTNSLFDINERIVFHNCKWNLVILSKQQN